MREHQGEKWDGNSPEINHYLSLLHKPRCSTFKGPQIMEAENTKSIYYLSNECNSANNERKVVRLGLDHLELWHGYNS